MKKPTKQQPRILARGLATQISTEDLKRITGGGGGGTTSATADTDCGTGGCGGGLEMSLPTPF